MRPVLSPENIYAHRHDEQDVVLWYNRALWHSIVSVMDIDVDVDPGSRDSQTDTAIDRVSQVIWPPDHASV